MKTIKLIPIVNSIDFTEKLNTEFNKLMIPTHGQNQVITINWEGGYFPVFRKWLIKEYGNDITQYNTFAIQST